ncbi:hypothetical protein [Pseudogemmobacter bohemicus]|uniref:hypothetical protein n=1 Tax=Pseudogemmobacter bohemicus TaxID=2250708 RepID=UPI000DD39C14|nr:hypothetical protein [Pseudogemmobacter bohemicus]
MAVPVYGDALRWISKEIARLESDGFTPSEAEIRLLCIFTADLFGKEIKDLLRDVQTMRKVQH